MGVKERRRFFEVRASSIADSSIQSPYLLHLLTRSGRKNGRIRELRDVLDTTLMTTRHRLPLALGVVFGIHEGTQ